MRTLFLAIFTLCAAFASTAGEIASPDGNFRLSVNTNAEGEPYYSLSYKGTPVISDSRLGLQSPEAAFDKGFRILGTDTCHIDRSWTPVWGEYSSIRDNFNELLVKFGSDASGLEMNIRFRLFNDGLGFRYELPTQEKANYLTLKKELTEFNFTGDHTLYCIPGDYDTDEFLFSEVPFSGTPEALARYKGVHSESEGIRETSVQTPLLLKTVDKTPLYISLHEAALIGYPGMSLTVDADKHTLTALLTPDRLGNCAYLQLPVLTPWRTLIVSDDARDILASQMILNLNEPCSYEDTSWIKPMKFVGVWWEMFVTDATWSYSNEFRAKPGITDYSQLKPNGRHAANTANVKRYIDFAAKNGIQGVLVEGWNEGWEDWASFKKNRQFLFDKPYPDFDIKELQKYAADKGVQIIMHHETAANAADYERNLDKAFSYMKDNGYNAVKTGYVGTIIPRSEHHTSQWMVEHVRHVIEKAADYRIMVDSHEAPKPTGLCRTYPNWLAQESARGGEFEAFGGNPPSHTCILPFTRLKGGPMDYTPGIFEIHYWNRENGKKAQAFTTLARQLALYLTMPSPIQMACDFPETYERFDDAFQFIRDVPIEWADSRYLEAEPNRYITVARLDKNSSDWYIGAITDDKERTAVIDFSFLPKGVKYVATIYEDAPDTHFMTNPQAYRIRTVNVNSKTKIKQRLAPGGGAAIRIAPAQIANK